MGYGLIDVQGSSLRMVEAGTWRAPARAPLEQRLARLALALAEAVDRLQPDSAAVEDVFVRVNVRAALAVGHGRGALLSVLGQKGLAVTPYAPASVKRSVTGNGAAGKEQVARMVGAILGLGRKYPHDATDALAVAITHTRGGRPELLAGK